MFFTQILLPALIILVAGLWGGARLERIRWESREKQKQLPTVRHMKRRKIDMKVG